MKTTIEVSARHVHLTKEDFKKLFGKDEITKRNNLSQKGEFAGEETLEVVGEKGRALKVRVLGPFRGESQLEISKTDAINLGVDAPYRESGNGGGGRVKLVGAKGELIDKISIVPMRHLHISTIKAKKCGVKDGDYVSIEIPGERSCELHNIVVRAADNFDNHTHLDTDDANAAGITKPIIVEFAKQKRR